MKLTWLVLFLLICGTVFAQIGYQADPNAKEEETLLLRDFQPESMLHVNATQVARAKFPVFDVHQLEDLVACTRRQDPGEDLPREC